MCSVDVKVVDAFEVCRIVGSAYGDHVSVGQPRAGVLLFRGQSQQCNDLYVSLIQISEV